MKSDDALTYTTIDQIELKSNRNLLPIRIVFTGSLGKTPVVL
jgi:hypothetical protein